MTEHVLANHIQQHFRFRDVFELLVQWLYTADIDSLQTVDGTTVGLLDVYICLYCACDSAALGIPVLQDLTMQRIESLLERGESVSPNSILQVYEGQIHRPSRLHDVIGKQGMTSLMTHYAGRCGWRTIKHCDWCINYQAIVRYPDYLDDVFRSISDWIFQDLPTEQQRVLNCKLPQQSESEERSQDVDYSTSAAAVDASIETDTQHLAVEDDCPSSNEDEQPTPDPTPPTLAVQAESASCNNSESAATTDVVRQAHDRLQATLEDHSTDSSTADQQINPPATSFQPQVQSDQALLHHQASKQNHEAAEYSGEASTTIQQQQSLQNSNIPGCNVSDLKPNPEEQQERDGPDAILLVREGVEAAIKPME